MKERDKLLAVFDTAVRLRIKEFKWTSFRENFFYDFKKVSKWYVGIIEEQKNLYIISWLKAIMSLMANAINQIFFDLILM
jgi:hypothetical protein